MKITGTGQEVRLKLKTGVNKLNDLVKHTLGPKAKHIVLASDYEAPLVIDDGDTIAKAFELEDEIENTGAQLAKISAAKTNRIAGDGTTTSIVLTNALVNQLITGQNLFDSRGQGQVKDEILAARDTVISYLDETKTNISKPEEIQQIASVSSGDEAVGKVISEIYEALGNEVVITQQEDKKPGLSYYKSEGLEWDKGLLSPYLASDIQKIRSIVNDTYIVIAGQPITMTSQLTNLVNKVRQAGKSQVVLIAEDIAEGVLNDLIVNAVRGFLVVAIHPAYYGDRRKEFLQDVAILTGGTIIDKLEEAKLEDLGQAERVEVTMTKTIIAGGKGKPEEIEKRANQITAQIESATSEFDTQKLKERLAKLKSGVAVIKIGMNTEAEQKSKMAKIEDAINAVKVAVEDGIVVGGGLALYRASVGLLEANNEVSSGTKILAEAIQAPYKQILENTGQYSLPENLMELGIIDPVKVTKTALNNAVSVALALNSCEGIIVPRREKKETQSV